MKTKRILLFLPLICLLFTIPAEGQLLKKLKKRSERAAEEAVLRKTEQKVFKETSKGMDSILNPETGKKEPAPGQNPPPPPPPPGNTGGNTGGNPQGQNDTGTQGSGGPKNMQVYSKFDFVPGDKQLFYDDFALDFIGDFPSKWNTNGSGEVVTIGDSGEKWFAFVPGYNTFYVPDVPSLPEEYTIEFDMLATGLDRKTASTAILRVILTDDKMFKWGNYVRVDIPFCQYHPVGFHVRNKSGEINNNIAGDIRNAVLEEPHVSIAVNKQRLRLWVNEKKYVDIPRIVPLATPPTALKFELLNFKDGKERFFLKNLKVAEGGVDLRRKLISEGEVSTNGILFDSGSANIQPQSMGIIRQISQVLQQESMMNLMIEGHTDSDGDDASNIDLSKRRADAVRNALVDVYNVAPSRLQTSGKGESEPVGDNGTTDGKAQNRRVVFKRV